MGMYCTPKQNGKFKRKWTEYFLFGYGKETEGILGVASNN